MTGSGLPPSESTPPPPTPAHPPVASTNALSASPPTSAPNRLGRLRIVRILVYLVAAIALLYMAKTILYHDPVKEMTDELHRVGAAEAVYRGTHPAFTASLAELQQQDRKVRLNSQLVQFEARKNGYQIVVRRANTDKQCTLIAGSFKPIGGEPEVTCTKVSSPR